MRAGQLQDKYEKTIVIPPNHDAEHLGGDEHSQKRMQKVDLFDTVLLFQAVDERIQLFRIIEHLPDAFGHIPKGGLESVLRIFPLHVRDISHSSDENRLDPAGAFSIHCSVGLGVALG